MSKALGWTLPAQLRVDFASSTKAAENCTCRKGLLPSHLWCPNNLYIRLWDKLEIDIIASPLALL